MTMFSDLLVAEKLREITKAPTVFLETDLARCLFPLQEEEIDINLNGEPDDDEQPKPWDSIGQVIRGITGRHTTYTYTSLFSTAVVIMLLSPLLNQPVLLFTGIALALYLLGILVWVLLAIPVVIGIAALTIREPEFRAQSGRS